MATPPPSSLLDEALGLAGGVRPAWRVATVTDCVETSGAFVLHHLLKRSLADGGAVFFLAFAQSFSHYERVLAKLRCNLSLYKNKNKLHFFDLLNLEFPGEKDKNGTEIGFINLYNRVLRALETIRSTKEVGVYNTIIIDDISILEIVAHGSEGLVLDFLHYCTTLVSELDCNLVILTHEDIYSSDDSSCLLSHLDYLSDIVMKIEPLSTGIATDVHGQMTILSKGSFRPHGRAMTSVHNFHFRVKENGGDYFYPGSKC